MNSSFTDALKNRFSCYALTPKCPLTHDQLKDLLAFALKNVPSAFNSQSTRLVLLLDGEYRKFWGLVKEELRKIVPAESFKETEERIDGFASGCGTVLFYEDSAVVEKLQADFPLYQDRFPIWSEHTSAMHQLSLWVMLEDNGMGGKFAAL